MPLLSSQARSLGRRAVIEFTFQVAMRMFPNLPGGTDNAVPPLPGPERDRTRTSAGRHTRAESPEASRRCSAPPSSPICRS